MECLSEPFQTMILGLLQDSGLLWFLLLLANMQSLHLIIQRKIRSESKYTRVLSSLDNWDMLLPHCKFYLNSTHSATTKQLPVFVGFGQEPNLLYEVSVYNETDFQV